MIFECQNKAMADLPRLSKCGTHGLVITGLSGCGKTYMAKEFARVLGIHDFHAIEPNMSDIRSMVEDANVTESDILYCIENMDDAVVSVAYPLLKLIEECPANVYVVITCNNINQIPDTIISRCAVLTISNPTKSDLSSYGMMKGAESYKALNTKHLWECVKSFTDIDQLYTLKSEQLSYFDNVITEFTKPKLAVSSVVWKLSHFEDKTPTPIVLMVRYLMLKNPTNSNVHYYLTCLNELEYNRISVNAILTKLVFDLKYVR